MDMNSNLGGLAAALKDMDVWVMNFAPTNKSSRLKIIFYRSLIGTVHNWYAFNLSLYVDFKPSLITWASHLPIFV